MIGCKPLSKEEQFKISASLETERDRMLFTLILKTGLRISEVLSIKIDSLFQYDALKSILTVEKRFTKGKVGTRNIPLSESLQRELFQYLKQLPKEQEFLFESNRGKLSRTQAWRAIKEAATRAGIKGKVATHSGRKSYAKTIYELSGRDLALTQRAMGHKSVNSTISYLSFISNEEVDDIILKGQE